MASALPTTALSRTMRDILALMGNLFVSPAARTSPRSRSSWRFNASNLGAEERSREHATMFAFGIRIRRVALMAVGESFALAVVGVGLSLGFGAAALHWILASVFPAAIPDLAVLEEIEAASYLVTVGIALAAALAAPWLNVRRMRTWTCRRRSATWSEVGRRLPAVGGVAAGGPSEEGAVAQRDAAHVAVGRDAGGVRPAA